MRWRGLLGCLLFLCLIQLAQADPEVEIIYPPKRFKRIKYSGYVDVSYNYLVRSRHLTSGVNNRLYDLEVNGPTLQQFLLNAATKPRSDWGMSITTVIGRDANELAPAGYNPNVFNIQNVGFAVPEAFVQYSREPFVVKIGAIRSLAGLETYDYRKNANFSRSILDNYAQPGEHVGVRSLARVNDKLSIIVGAFNGWSTIKQSGTFGAAELGLSYFLRKSITLMIDGYTGDQHLTDKTSRGPFSRRNLIDMYAVWHATDKLRFSTNIDYGWQNKASLPNKVIGQAIWKGIGVYSSYMLSDQWEGSVRGEVFSDSDGYRTGVKQNWRELTLTLRWLLRKNFYIDAETRHDFSNVPAFVDRNGVRVNNNQQSYALEALYRFG